MLTSRMKKIIQILLNNDDYITIASIATELEVSSRTILRELNSIQKWFEKNGGTFDKKKGKGVRFLEKDISRKMVKQLLVEAKSEIIYTPEERKIILRAKLLQFDEPTKLFALTGLLNVTESTIGNDLDSLKDWFNNYHLIILKKSGLGIQINGTEKSKRKAIVALIYEHFQMNELIQVISKRTTSSEELFGLEKKINSAILELLDVNSLSYIREIIVSVENEMGYQFADNGYIALAIRFGVTLKRRRFWGKIEIEDKHFLSLKKDKILLYATEYLSQKEFYPLNELPYIELVYLTMHIKGTKLRDMGAYNKVSMIEDFKIIQLVKEFVRNTEAETGIYLSDNEQLIIGLVKHLRPAIYRIKMDLDIINPLVEEIRNMYPKLFKAIKNSIKVVEKKENIEVPDHEIAYLATHVGAVIHKSNRELIKKYRVVVACMYGIGASSFLTAQLKMNFPNIVITEIVSVMDEQIMSINEKEVDLLITTVPLTKVNIPFVLIDPILKPKDIIKINQILNELVPTSALAKTIKRSNLKEKLMSLNEYSDIIIKLLDNFSYNRECKLRSMKDLIQNVSCDLSESIEEERLLYEAFHQREEKGSTILSKKGMILLHCRAEIRKELALKIIHLEETIFVQKGTRKVPVNDIVVMVAPVILNKKMLETLSEISRSIITEDFIKVIQTADQMQIESKLSLILKKYYESLVLNET